MASLNEQGQVEGKVKAALRGAMPSRYDAITDNLGLDKIPRKDKAAINKANSSGQRPVPARSTRR